MMKSSRRLALTLILGSAALVMALVALVFTMLPSSPVSVPVNKTIVTQPTLTGSYANAHSAIYAENQRSGTGRWQLDASAHLGSIQGYAGQVSALPGARVPLYISTVAPSSYQLDVYRIGWYQGTGGRLVASIKNLHSQAQGIWTADTGLNGCFSCVRDPQTHELETHWKVSYTLAIGTTWLSGVYLIKMTTVHHDEGYIILVVRAAHAGYAALVNLPVNTYQAYNLWGGYSLYLRGVDGSYDNRAVKVSFDRPYARGVGAADFLS